MTPHHASVHISRMYRERFKWIKLGFIKLGHWELVIRHPNPLPGYKYKRYDKTPKIYGSADIDMFFMAREGSGYSDTRWKWEIKWENWFEKIRGLEAILEQDDLPLFIRDDILFNLDLFIDGKVYWDFESSDLVS